MGLDSHILAHLHYYVPLGIKEFVIGVFPINTLCEGRVYKKGMIIIFL